MRCFRSSGFVPLCAALGVVSLTACSSDPSTSADPRGSGETDTGGAAGAAMRLDGGDFGGSRGEAGDRTAPTLRDVRVDIEGPLGATFDVDTREETFFLANDTTAVFTVFARDDISAAEDLTVEVFAAGGSALPARTSEFDNGLWRIRVDVARGVELRVRVADQAGNETESEGRLVLLSTEAALVGHWQARFYENALAIRHRWTSVWTEDTWLEVQEDSGQTRGGTYSVAGDVMIRTETHGPEDSDTSTVEAERKTTFYLDGQFFSEAPFARVIGRGDSVIGTWERRTETFVARGSALEPATDITETLIFGADAWSLQRSGRIFESGSSTTVEQTEAGTYTVQLSSSYTAGASFFLGRRIAERDGEVLSEPEDLFEFFVTRLDNLLISPFQR